MNHAKYIVTEQGMIVFPSHMNHDDVARKFTDPRMDVKEQVISAGFCGLCPTIDGEIVYGCFGESKNLNKHAREKEDAQMLQRLLDPLSCFR